MSYVRRPSGNAIIEGVKKRVQYWLQGVQWKNIGILAAISALLIMIAVQFSYPLDSTRPFATVDGVAVGGMSRDEADRRLDEAYRAVKVDIVFGSVDRPYRSPALETLGGTVNNDQVLDAVAYPWWLRLVPTSLWWGHLLAGNQTSKVTFDTQVVRAYMTSELGESCIVSPQNATIMVSNDATLSVKKAEDGGMCKLDDVVRLVSATSVSIMTPNIVKVPMERVAPVIGDDVAEKLLATIKRRLAQSVTITHEGTNVTIDANTIISWLVFDIRDGEIITKVDETKAASLLNEKLGSVVAKAPGVVTITTRDFQEISRTGGGDGQVLNVAGTTANIASYLTGHADSVLVATASIPPQQKFIRSYSPTDTGMSALIRHYAESHPGTYGVSLIELSGKRRRAAFNDTHKFTTASTYKVYVAYSTLKRVESGEFKWSDQIAGGRNLEKCFDDMIVLSDNACAEALVKRIGYTPIHRDITGLGLTNTSFIDAESYKTTAGDLSTFMASLEAGQLPLSSSSRDRLLAALRRNVYRQGVPAGANGSVADKVGFLNGLLHDTAVVYSPSGTYVLTIMTDGSSWADIAGLTREIEKIRAQ